MAIKDLYPSIEPTLNLDFANVKALDPRVTFSRPSTGTYYGTQTAKAEENLLVRSQEFDNADWFTARSTILTNNTEAPDGTTTADAIMLASGNTTAATLSQVQTLTANQTYTVSFFAKPNGKNFLCIQDTFSDGNTRRTWFDVQNGTVGNVNGKHTATITLQNNLFYRCSITFTTNATRTSSLQVFMCDTNNTITVADDGGGLYLWGAQIEQRSSVTAYTPTTDQPITNYIPVLETASANVARFDHDPVTGESLGLLVEEQRTNLFVYSEQFDNAAWTKTDATVTSNTIVAPDGTLTGDKFVEDTSTGFHRIARTLSFVSGTTYTFSVYAKAGERTRFTLETGGANLTFTVTTFDLVSGTVVSGTGTITDVGNGFYRCSISSLATGTGSSSVFTGLTDFGTRSYTGDGYSGIYIWGAQLEAGEFPTSYIKTEASQVTRISDDPAIFGSNFSSWFRQDEGSFYIEVTQFNNVSTPWLFQVKDATNSDFLGIIDSANVNNRRLFVRKNGLTQVDAFADGKGKTAISYKVNDFAISTNSSTPTTDLNGLLSVYTDLFIGNANSQSVRTNGYIKKLAYYPKRLTNEQLQALTV